MILSHRPATVTVVTIDDTEIDLDDLLVNEAKGTIIYKPAVCRLWLPRALHVIEYDAGFVTESQAEEDPPIEGPDIPSDLVKAVIIIAQHLRAQETRTQFDVASTRESQIDSGEMETRYFDAGKSGGLPTAATSLLEQYRRYS